MRRRKNESGSAVVEYALLAAGIAAAAIVPLFTIQTLLGQIFEETVNQLEGPPVSVASTVGPSPTP